MGTQNQNEVTGNETFDNILSSLQLLHEYIQANNDDLTFALLFGGVVQDSDMHLINSSVGNLSNPTVFKAAVQSLTKTMQESDLFTKLIFSAYHNYQSKSNVKVVKLSVDSPEDALLILRNLLKDEHGVSSLEDLPVELLQKMVDSMPPDLKRGFYEGEPCDDPDCPACFIKRRLKRKRGDYVDFSELFFFNKDNKGN